MTVAAAHITHAQSKEMSLKDVLQRTSVGNRQLQIRALELKRADELVKEAKSYLLPSVQFNSSYLVFAERPVIYLRNETTSPKLNDVKYGGRYAFDGTVTANYQLINPSAKVEIASAELQRHLGEHQLYQLEEQLAFELSQMYYTILLYKQQKKVFLQSLERNEQALSVARNLFLQGKGLKTDTLSHSIAVQNIRLSISSIDKRIHVGLLQMKQLMGVEQDTEIELSDSLVINTEAAAFDIESADFETAVENRQDLLISKLEVERYRLLQQKAKTTFKPQLMIFAQYQVQSQADDYRFSNYNFPRTSFAGVRLSIPLYNGNRTKYKVAGSSFNIKQQELAVADLRSKVQTELVSLAIKLNEEKKQLQIRQQHIQSAMVNYAMINERYRAGLSTRLELADADLLLTTVRLEELGLFYSIQLIYLEMQKNMGSLKLNRK